MIGELRMNPFLNRDHCGLLDVKAAVEELNHFVEYGGNTVVDPMSLGIGRDPCALQRISRRTGLNIVMGAGFYLEPSHPPYVRDITVEAIAEAISRDCGVSEDGPEVCAGMEETALMGEDGLLEAWLVPSTRSRDTITTRLACSIALRNGRPFCPAAGSNGPLSPARSTRRRASRCSGWSSRCGSRKGRRDRGRAPGPI